MENKEYKMIGQASEEQISQWKNTHRKIMAIEIIDGEEKHIVYFKRPNLETMSAVTKVTKTDEMQGAKVLFDNCYLGGSAYIKDDAILFFEVSKQLGEMMNSCRSSLKNL